MYSVGNTMNDHLSGSSQVEYDSIGSLPQFVLTTEVTDNQTIGNQESSWSVVGRYIVGVLLTVIILVTLSGNFLVVLAVINYRRLRTVTNYLIVSLATADITVSVLVMPYAVLYDVAGTWRFGWIFCYFFNSCDVMCCTASILHLCTISLDRYWAITDPLRYSRCMSKTRTSILIAGAWVCSALISFIPIYSGWFVADGAAVYVDSPECALNVNKIYAVVSAMTSFYIPLLVMVFVYVRIFKIAQAQAREIVKQEIHLNPSQSITDANKSKRSFHKDSKAIKTLGTIMGIFIVSWLPFFLMYVILPFCESCYIPRVAISAITWLGYANSFMNPIVYAFLNKDFSNAFKRLLYCKRLRGRDTRIKMMKVDRRNGTLENSASSMREKKELCDIPIEMNNSVTMQL